MEWLIGGGLIMIPLLVCSLLSLAVIIDRLVHLRKNKILRPELINSINALSGPKDIPYLSSKCDEIQGSFANIIRRAYLNQHLTREEKIIDIQATGRHEAQILEHKLIVLEIIATITPLLGLLGTVMGMSEVFDVIANIGLGHAKEFSSGIAKALRTTIFGLGVAIPTLIAHSSFVKRIDNFILEMEKNTTLILNTLYSHKN
ncbi:MAG: MotA/TolQ/ExbB proton channel family protein [Candidatus Anammoxibacter sp.]